MNLNPHPKVSSLNAELQTASFGFRLLLALLLACLSGCNRNPGESGTPKLPPLKTTPPIVGAYYYPWYTDAKWKNEPAPHTPQLGRYHSDDPTVLTRHVQWARQAGLDFFIVSWLSAKSTEADNLRKSLLPVLEKERFRFIILYETRLALGLSYTEPADLARTLSNGTTAGHTMLEQFEHLADTYFQHPSYLQIDGQPVVIVYAMEYMANAGPYFDLLRQRMAKRGVALHLIADMVYWGPLEKNDWKMVKNHFRAVTGYNMYPRTNFLAAVHARFQLVESFARTNGLRLIPNVMPGYDDTKLRGLDREILQRNDGQFYQQYWNLASEFVDQKQPFLFITSFNEWLEGSEIEPSAQYGDRYLTLTRERIEQLRTKLASPVPASTKPESSGK